MHVIWKMAANECGKSIRCFARAQDFYEAADTIDPKSNIFIDVRWQDSGFGCPVTLLNVPMVEVRREWVPEVNQRELQERVVEALVFKHSRLTGSEIRFIRLFAEMTLEKFAERFDVSHPAVLKWEKSGLQATAMTWTTEKDIRLFALTNLSPKAQQFIVAYEQLIDVAHDKPEAIKIDLEKRSA